MKDDRGTEVGTNKEVETNKMSDEKSKEKTLFKSLGL